MYYQVDQTGTLAALKTAVDRVLATNPSYLSIFACDDNGFQKTELDPFLQSLPIPVCGGVYPRLIVNDRIMQTGSIVIGVDRPGSFMVIPDLSDDTLELDRLIDEQFPQSPEFRSVFIFVDGLAAGIPRMIKALFNVFGLEVNYIGCAAGSLSLQKTPCVFSNQGILTDGAVIIASTLISSVGVRHGFRSIAGPFRITGAKGTTIHTLNWEPAVEVYKRAVETYTAIPFQDSDFSSLAVRFPFGINKLGGEVLVRDVLKIREDGSLVCGGELSEGDFVDILHGDRQSLLDASRKAAEESSNNLPGDVKNHMTLFVDCISRYLFLENAFEEELKNVSSANRVVLGACTLGEIANTGLKYLEFYNKTAVVAQIETL